MKIVRRKVIRTGTALAIVLPAQFVRSHDIRHGDHVAVVIGQWLQVMPLNRLDILGAEIEERVRLTLKQHALPQTGKPDEGWINLVAAQVRQILEGGKE